MTELAHFTATELPGSLAIWITGIGLGLALASPAPGRTAPPLALMAALAGLGMLGDAAGWSQVVRLAVDATFLAAAVLLAHALWRRRDRRSPELTPGPGSGR